MMGRSPDSCLAFLRDLGSHGRRVIAGDADPEHVRACPACAGHLRFAVAVAAQLSQRPAVPAALASPRFLEAIHERIVRDLEGAVAPSLRAAFRGELSASEFSHPPLPWPVQSTQPALEESLRSLPSMNAPALLWPRVRRHVATMAYRSRAAVVRRAGVLAASVAVCALLGWKFGQAHGTSSNIQIVFVTANELSPSFQPPMLHPTVALRRGGDR